MSIPALRGPSPLGIPALLGVPVPWVSALRGSQFLRGPSPLGTSPFGAPSLFGVPVPRLPCTGGSQLLGGPRLWGAQPWGCPDTMGAYSLGASPCGSQTPSVVGGPLNPSLGVPALVGPVPGTQVSAWGGVPVPRASPAMPHVTHLRVHIDDVALVHVVHPVVPQQHHAAAGAASAGATTPHPGTCAPGPPLTLAPVPHGDPQPGGTRLA